MGGCHAEQLHGGEGGTAQIGGTWREEEANEKGSGVRTSAKLGDGPLGWQDKGMAEAGSRAWVGVGGEVTVQKKRERERGREGDLGAGRRP